MKLTRFQESLLVMSAMKNNMENDIRVVKRYIHDDDVKYSITNKMLIDICSFLGEWKRFGNYPRNDEHIKNTIIITAPAIKRIMSWRGIEGQRNTMLAHGFRDDNNNGNLTCLNKRYFESEVPTQYAEIILLSEFCVYVCAAFVFRHKEDHALAFGTLPNVDFSVSRGIKSLDELNADVKKLLEHMFRLDPQLKKFFGV